MTHLKTIIIYAYCNNKHTPIHTLIELATVSCKFINNIIGTFRIVYSVLRDRIVWIIYAPQ